jgi:hypothetical protein
MAESRLRSPTTTGNGRGADETAWDAASLGIDCLTLSSIVRDTPTWQLLQIVDVPTEQFIGIPLLMRFRIEIEQSWFREMAILELARRGVFVDE